MGSYTRTDIYYTDLPNWLAKQNTPKFAAIMEGTNAHQIQFPQGGILVMGNESNGLSTEVLELCENKLTIPRFGEAESLNVAMATAVLCDGIRRQNPL
jgi:TrmH family RNA methyltransferase